MDFSLKLLFILCSGTFTIGATLFGVSPHSPMLIRLIYLNERGGQAPPLLRCDSLKSWESVAMASVHLKRRRHTQNCTNNVNERSGSCSPEPAAVLQVMTIRRVPADCFTRNTILPRLIIT